MFALDHQSQIIDPLTLPVYSQDCSDHLRSSPVRLVLFGTMSDLAYGMQQAHEKIVRKLRATARSPKDPTRPRLRCYTQRCLLSNLKCDTPHRFEDQRQSWPAELFRAGNADHGLISHLLCLWFRLAWHPALAFVPTSSFSWSSSRPGRLAAVSAHKRSWPHSLPTEIVAAVCGRKVPQCRGAADKRRAHHPGRSSRC